MQNTEKLDAVLAHHIVVGAIETMALIDDTSIVTTSDTLTVQVSADNGIVYIGQEKAKVRCVVGVNSQQSNLLFQEVR